MSNDVHHEVELVVALGPDARSSAMPWASTSPGEICKAAPRNSAVAWDTAKAFDHSAPIEPDHVLPAPPLTSGAITLDVNGQRRQTGRCCRDDLECAKRSSPNSAATLPEGR
jgi:fumarylpyruvate hydrolase